MKLESVVNSFSIIYKTLFLCSFLFLTTLSAQYIQITKPTAAQVIPNKSNLLEIAWITSIKTGHVRIEYSIDNKNYIEVSKEGINESPFNWFIPENIGTNKHGDLYIRVIVSEKKIIKDEVNIVVPELASTGSMVFETQLDDVFINIKNKKTLRPGEILRDLEPGEYYYTAKKQKYGQEEGKVVVKAGKREKIKLNLTKTWGSVTFTSKENEDFRIQINRKTHPFEQEPIKQFDAKKKIIYLEKGDYVFSVLKANYREYKDSFTIIPNKPITIPINLTPQFANVRFLSNAPRTMFYTSIRNTEVYLGPAEKIFKLDEGTHTIVAKANNYRRYEKEFVIDPFKALNEFEIKMVREYGSVRIRSYPPGADILVDRKPINEVTPYTVDSITVELHSFMVKLDGYRTASSKKYITDRGSLDIYFPLKEKLGSLHVKKKTKNQKIRLTIDGTLETPIENNQYFSLSLEPGLHKIEIRSLGYEAIKETRNIYDDKEEFIRPKWDPILVKVNLKPLRQAPKMTLLAKGNKEYNKMDITGQGSLELPFGKYMIMAKAPKYEKSQKPFTIKSNEQKFITPELTRKSIKKAKNYGWFPGAGLIYAEKPKLGIGLLAGTLGAGSYFIYKDDEYRKESKKLHNLQTEYLSQTDQVQIAASKALRDAQREKRDKIGSEANISLMTTMALYGLNIGITWFFHGL